VQLQMPKDERFEWVDAPEGIRPFEAKNLALGKVQDGWVGVLAVGDVLGPTAFFQLAWEMQRAPKALGFYCNEVQVDAASHRLSDFFSKRPASLPTLLHWNYIGRFWCLRRDTIEGFPLLDSGSDEHLVLVRALQKGDVQHVPYTLYYRRESFYEPPVDESLRKAIAQHLPTGWSAALVGDSLLRVTPSTTPTSVTAIVCFRDRAEMTLSALKALMDAHRGNVSLEIILVNNDSNSESLAAIAPFLSTYPIPVRLVNYAGVFNFGRMHNWVVKEHCQSELLLLLNNDVVLDSTLDLEHWAAWAQQPEMATVGIQLRYPNGETQHSGIRAWFGGEARLARIGNSHADDRITRETREVYANTFAACMMRRETYLSLGGLRETDLVNGFGDVAFCLEAVRRGLHHLYLGSMGGLHFESTSRGPQFEYWEEFGLEREYPELVQKMLREDLGLNRIPGADHDIPAFLASALKVQFRKNSQWLNPVKPTVKKWLRTWVEAKDSG